MNHNPTPNYTQNYTPNYTQRLQQLPGQNPNNSIYSTVAQAYTAYPSVLNPPNLKNPETFRYNNIKGGVERIKEYVLDIDSSTRNPLLFPDPFNYTLNYTLNYTINSPENDYAPAPVIQMKFNNIRYIKLLGVQMPRYYFIDMTQPTNPTLDTTQTLDSFRFIELCLKVNMGQNDIITTRANSSTYRQTVKLYNKNWTNTSNNFYYATPSTDLLYYFNMDNLGTINNISVSFFNSSYQPINFNYTTAEALALENTSNISPKNENYQHVISLLIGTIDPEIINIPDFT